MFPNTHPRKKKKGGKRKKESIRLSIYRITITSAFGESFKMSQNFRLHERKKKTRKKKRRGEGCPQRRGKGHWVKKKKKEGKREDNPPSYAQNI